MDHPLIDITWRTLSGPHAQHAVGSGGARRYAPGFSPIVGFADNGRPDFEALRLVCEPGEPFYCDGWSGPAPAGWRIEAETTMFKMLWSAPPPADESFPEAVRLTPQHAAQALELALLTKPGPFGLRTPELGEYFGCFDGARLVAMAGERMFDGRLREISGVCTHPDHQGRGLARRLMTLLIRRQLQRGETPFLHVMSANAAAHGLYRRMGFEDVHEAVVRVVARER